jgi:sporulation protein YlmC with PRC-barrel domain
MATCKQIIMKENELDNETGSNHAGNHANEPVKLLTASSIVGDRVLNKQGEDLGKIIDLMVNLDNGNIQYVVIAFGGFMGMYRKYFAVPFDVLTIVPEQRAFIFDQSRESFENHPGFNKKHWPLANFHSQLSRSYSGFMGPNTGTDH